MASEATPLNDSWRMLPREIVHHLKPGSLGRGKKAFPEDEGGKTHRWAARR